MAMQWTRRKSRKLSSASAILAIDKSNPLNAGLTSAFDLGRSYQNLAGGSGDGFLVDTSGTGISQKYDPIMGLVRDFAGIGTDPRLRGTRPIFDTPTGKLTLVFSVYVRGTGEGDFGRIIDAGLTITDPGPKGWAVYPAGVTSTIRFSSHDSTYVDSGAHLVSGKFNLVVITLDGTAVVIYINGVQSASGTVTAPALLSGAISIEAPSIGNRAGSGDLTRDFDGQLGPMLFYNRAWKPGEVSSLGTRPEDIYQLFRIANDPRFYTAASGNTDVFKDLSVSYGIQTYLTKDLSTAYTISNGVVKELSSTYTVYAYLAKSLSGSYTITSLVNQTGYPISDISAGTWTPSVGSTLWETLDDASDLDYIITNTDGLCKVNLTSLGDPGVSGAYSVEYRVFSSTGSTLTVSLRQGTTEIKSWTHAVPAVSTSYSQALSQIEADLITDHTTLALWFTHS